MNGAIPLPLYTSSWRVWGILISMFYCHEQIKEQEAKDGYWEISVLCE